MTFERCTIQDAETLRSIAEQTYRETFSADNKTAIMDAYTQEAFNSDKIETELRNPDSTFYFGVDNDVCVGYIKLNVGEAQTELQETDSLELERIYVLQAYQGKRYGQQMLDFAIHQARRQGMQSIWLGVWEHNIKARKFYEKNGFARFGEHDFVMGDDRQTDYLLRKQL